MFKRIRRCYYNNPLKEITPPFSFLAVTLLAVALAIANASQVICPTCQGEGSLKVAQGLEAQIIDSVQTDRHVPAGCCDNPVAEYSYLLTVNVANPSSTDIKGVITIDFFDPLGSNPRNTDEVVGFSTLEVEIPGNSNKIYTTTCFLREYGPMLELPHRAVISSDNLKSDVNVPCSVCEGQGKITFFTWLEERAK